MFETGVVRVRVLIIAPGQDAKYGIFSIFFNMEVYCVFPLMKTHNISFSI